MLSNIFHLGLRLAEKQIPIYVHPEKCLHSRHKLSSCSKCQDICPAQAVQLEEYLNVELSCQGCNLCIAVCPTEALESKKKSLPAFYSEVRRKSEENERLIFHCNHVIDHFHSGISLSCLGELDDITILLAIANGVKNFYFLSEMCATCDWRKGNEVFHRRFNKWKETWQRLNWEYINNSEEMKLLNQEKQLVNTDKINRREFFNMIAKETRTSIKESVQLKKDVSPWNNGELASLQSLRLDIYQNWIKPKIDIQTLQTIKRLDVNENCLGCTICGKVCPTHAIAIDDILNKPVCNVEQCIDCNLCVDVCYRKAISIKD